MGRKKSDIVFKAGLIRIVKEHRKICKGSDWCNEKGYRYKIPSFCIDVYKKMNDEELSEAIPFDSVVTPMDVRTFFDANPKYRSAIIFIGSQDVLDKVLDGSI